MSKHTPGPWEIEWESCDCEPGCGCRNPYPYRIYAPNRLVKPYKSLPPEPAEIANLVEVNFALPHEEAVANAHLLDAAPGLLAACESLVECQRYYGEHAFDKDGMPGNAFYSDLFMAVVRLAREAIRKAEGAAQ